MTDPYDLEVLLAAFEREDPALAPVEKETSLRFARDQDRARFFTAEAGVGRRLLAHKHTQVEEVVVREGAARVGDAPDSVDEDDQVVGVRGTLPIGTLSIRRDPRQNDQHAAVVTKRVLREADE
jgi:hypothetical protein